ncbi:MAG: phage tail tape measure protein [Bacteroidales bacterium]|jgi:TP901 family phage tail tape measure protein|nr:phage tail tape measure protein [Bacteroidales bacterium]
MQNDMFIIDRVVNPKEAEQLKALKKAIDACAESISGMLEKLRKIDEGFSGAKNWSEFVKLMEKATETQKKLAPALNEQDRLKRRVDEITKKVAESYLEEAKKLEELRQKQRERNEELRKEITLNKSEEGSIVRMRVELSRMTKAYDAMSKTMRESDAGRQAQKDIKALVDELKELEHATGRDNRNVGNYFNSIKKGLLGVVAILGIDDVMGALKGAFNTIVDFEQANANLAAVMGKSAGEVKSLTEEAKRLGETTEYSASQVTELQTELAKLGFNQQEITDSTEWILKFATAMDADLGRAAELAGNTLRAFGMDVTETERVVSAMAVGANRSALDFNDLQTALSDVIPIAARLNFSIEDVVTLLGVLSDSGFDASSAGTATKNILLNLADANGELAKSLGRPVESLDDLVSGLKELDAQGINLQETLNMTSRQSVAAFNTFLAGTDSLITLRNSITDVGDELTQLQETRMNTVTGATKQLKSAVEGLILRFSESTGIFRVAISALTGFVNVLAKCSGFLKVATIAVLSYVAAVKLSVLWTKTETGATLLSIVALKAKTFVLNAAKAATWLYSAAVSLLTGNIRGATFAFQVFTKAIQANPIGLALSAVTLLVTGIIALTRRSREASSAVADFSVQLSKEKKDVDDLFTALKKSNEGTQERTRLIEKINEKYGSYLKNQLDEKTSLEGIAKAQKEVTEAMTDNLVMKSMEKGLSKYMEKVAKAQESYIENMDDVLNNLSNSSRGTFIARMEEIEDSFRKGEISAEEMRNKVNDLYYSLGGIKTSEAITDLSGFRYSLNELKESDDQLVTAQTRLNEVFAAYREETGKDKKATDDQNTSGEDKITVSNRIIAIQEELIKQEEKLKTLRAGDAVMDLKGIETAEEKIKQLKDEMATLQGKTDTDNGSGKKSAEERAAFEERAAKARMEIWLREKDAMAEVMKKESEDVKNSLAERLDYSDRYYGDLIDKVNVQAEAELGKVKENADEQENIRDKANREIEKLQQQATGNRVKIIENETKRIIDELSRQKKAREDALNMDEKREIAGISASDTEKYEKEREDIQKKYRQKRIDAEKRGIEAIISMLEKLLDKEELTSEQRLDLAKKLADAKVELEETVLDEQINAQEEGLKSEEKAHKKKLELHKEEVAAIKKYADITLDLFSAIADLIGAISDRNISRIDEQIEKINEAKNAELERLEEAAGTEETIAAERARIEAQAAAQTERLEAEKQRQRERAARWEKAQALAQIQFNTAMAIMNILSTTKPWPLAIALTIVAAATGATQTAVVAATPIPKYAHGGEDVEGLAIVGDAGKKEYIRTKGGKVYETPARDTLVNLQEKVDIFPDYRSLIAAQNMEITGKYRDLHSEKIDYRKLSAMISEPICHAIEANKSNISINYDDKYNWRVRNGNDRMNYLNKRISV